MIYSHNIVTHKIGVIFANDKCKDIDYKNVKQRCESAIDLFSGILEFTDDIEIYHNATKRKIIEVMEGLNKRAEEFERRS